MIIKDYLVDIFSPVYTCCEIVCVLFVSYDCFVLRVYIILRQNATNVPPAYDSSSQLGFRMQFLSYYEGGVFNVGDIVTERHYYELP